MNDTEPKMQKIAGIDPVELKTNTIHPELQLTIEEEESGDHLKEETEVTRSPPSKALQMLLKARKEK